jgi:hypothetical protein
MNELHGEQLAKRIKAGKAYALDVELNKGAT